MPLGSNGHWVGQVYHTLDSIRRWCLTCERPLGDELGLDHLMRTARYPDEVREWAELVQVETVEAL